MTKKKLTTKAGFFQQISSNLDANLDKYYLSSDFKQIKIGVKTNLILFHLNISSFPYHFLELHILLATSETEFDIIDITESRLKSNKTHLTNITLPNDNIEHRPTNRPKQRWIRLYIKKMLFIKKKSFKNYQSKIFESISINIINPSTKNFIVACIHRHPGMELSQFNNDFFTYVKNYSVKKKTWSLWVISMWTY